jgi:hypothetical protein
MRPREKRLRLPRGIRDGAVAKFENEPGIANLRALFEPRRRLGIIFGQHRDRHRLLGQDFHRHLIMRQKID